MKHYSKVSQLNTEPHQVPFIRHNLNSNPFIGCRNLDVLMMMWICHVGFFLVSLKQNTKIINTKKKNMITSLYRIQYIPLCTVFYSLQNGQWNQFFQQNKSICIEFPLYL